METLSHTDCGANIFLIVLALKTLLELEVSLNFIILNSKRDRLDGVVSNLLVAKMSKHGQFGIAQSRKKNIFQNSGKNERELT